MNQLLEGSFSIFQCNSCTAWKGATSPLPLAIFGMILHQLWKKGCPNRYTDYSARDSPSGNLLLNFKYIWHFEQNKKKKLCKNGQTKHRQNMCLYKDREEWKIQYDLIYPITYCILTEVCLITGTHQLTLWLRDTIKCSLELSFHLLPLWHQEECLLLQGHPQSTVDILCLDMCCAWNYKQTLGNAAALCSLVYNA